MRYEELVHHREVAYVVVLQDGTQLDGVLARYDGYLAVANTTFATWQVDAAFVDRGELEEVQLA